MQRRLTALLACAVLTAAACSDTETSSGPQKTTRAEDRIDEKQGTFRGVSLGGSPRSIERALGPGEAGGVDRNIAPTGLSEDALLTFGATQPPTRGTVDALTIVRYADVTYLATEPDGIYATMIVAEGAATTVGVAIGDHIELVERRYPSFECGEKNAGTEYRPFKFCTGRVADERFVWFGGDPISSITLAAIPMGGGDPPT